MQNPVEQALEQAKRATKRGGTFIFLVVLGFYILSSLFVSIGAGERGVVFNRLNGGVQDVIKTEGLKLKIPFVESVIKMPVTSQKIYFARERNYESGTTVLGPMSASSLDLQDVYVDAVITYHLDESELPDIYRKLKKSYQEKKVIPKTVDAVKTHTAKFKVAEMLTNREQIKQNVFESLAPDLAKDGIILEEVNITNFDFDEDFKQAIEARQVAEQEAQKQRYVLEQQEIKAQEKVKLAEAERQAKILEGEGIAEFNRLIEQELTDKVIQYKQLENQREAIAKWNGGYPTTYMGDGAAVPLINIGN